jgi:hypothetical protein
MIMSSFGQYLPKTVHDHETTAWGQLTLFICQTPIAAAMATTAVAPNRAG